MSDIFPTFFGKKWPFCDTRSHRINFREKHALWKSCWKNMDENDPRGYKITCCEKYILGKIVEKIIIFFRLWWPQNPLFSKKLSTSLFFENVYQWHKMVTFFQKMSEKCPTKMMEIMFCYGKTLFMKSDKVAELTFFGADFQLLWSTLWP